LKDIEIWPCPEKIMEIIFRIRESLSGTTGQTKESTLADHIKTRIEHLYIVFSMYNMHISTFEYVKLIGATFGKTG
jgi:hypothetical protein